MDAASRQATRDALKRMENAGFDLSKPLVMDFFVAVPSKSAGDDVAKAVADLGFNAKVESDSETGEWTCYCTIELIPELSAVLQIEERLDKIGRTFGGRADGFGSFGNAS